MNHIRPARPDEMGIVRRLFLEYAESLGFSLCFQGFDQELATLPGKYAEPEGTILLAVVDNEPAGVVGLRPLDGTICEMKRLYVHPAHRGLKLGRLLADHILSEARDRGYTHMRLDTLPNMEAARMLYASMGFSVIPAYYDNTPCGSICMEKVM
jgi:ribosomal protein S18 acetylase RimI-like enzyme